MIEILEVEYLLSNFFSNSINKNEFLENYFRFFLYNEKNNGELLFDEGDDLKYIFLIKEGHIEFSLHTTLLELSILIRQLYRNFNLAYTQSKSEKNLLSKYNSYKEINTPKDFKILCPNSIVGMEENVLKIPRHFKAKVSSKILKYYAIPIDVIL